MCCQLFRGLFLIPHWDSQAETPLSIPSHEKIEIVVVDDCTQGFVAFESAKPKAKLKIIQQSKRCGAGSARNRGLLEATGKWVIFADADDLFEDGAFETFFSLQDSPADIIFFKANSFYEDSNRSCSRHFAINELLQEFLEGGKEANLRYRFSNPVCKMYNRTFIENNKLRFEEVPFSNDVMFSIQSQHLANRIEVMDKIVYRISSSEGSLTKTITLDSVQCRFEVLLRKNSFLRSIGREQYQSSIMYHLTFSLRHGITPLLRFIELAKEEHAQIFFGWEGWFRGGCNLAKQSVRELFDK